jgi:hypothetical protein
MTATEIPTPEEIRLSAEHAKNHAASLAAHGAPPDEPEIFVHVEDDDAPPGAHKDPPSDARPAAPAMAAPATHGAHREASQEPDIASAADHLAAHTAIAIGPDVIANSAVLHDETPR